MRDDGVMKLLKKAGIETPEEIEDVTKVIDKETGEVGALAAFYVFLVCGGSGGGWCFCCSCFALML